MSWIVDYTHENLDQWEPEECFGPFRSAGAAEKFAEKMRARRGFDWTRDDYEVRELTKPDE